MFAFQANIKILSVGEEESKHRSRVEVEYAGHRYKAVIAKDLLKDMSFPSEWQKASMYMGTRLKAVGECNFSESFFNILSLTPYGGEKVSRQVTLSGYPVRLIQDLTVNLRSPGVFIVFSILNIDADRIKSLTYCRAYNDMARDIKDFYDSRDKFVGHITLSGYFRPWAKAGIIFEVTSFDGVTDGAEQRRNKMKNKEMKAECQN